MTCTVLYKLYKIYGAGLGQQLKLPSEGMVLVILLATLNRLQSLVLLVRESNVS